jgi:hypothetical protein
MEGERIQPENAQSVRANLMIDASIQGGVGEATVLLPSEVGVRAKAGGGLGKINAEGLQRQGDSYVNDAYGSFDVTLDVDVRGGVGEINLKSV